MELVAILSRRDSRWVFRFPYTSALLIVAEVFHLFCLSSAVLAYYQGVSTAWCAMRGASAIIVICQLLGPFLDEFESLWKYLFGALYSYYTITVGLGDPFILTNSQALQLLIWQEAVYKYCSIYLIALGALALVNKTFWVLVSLASPQFYLRLHGFKLEKDA